MYERSLPQVPPFLVNFSGSMSDCFIPSHYNELNSRFVAVATIFIIPFPVIATNASSTGFNIFLKIVTMATEKEK
jgi:hypothetical protein